MIHTVLMLGWCWPPPAFAACDEDAVQVALHAAEQAFGRKDLAGMNAAIVEVRKSLACMREPANPALCARVHRARALGAWLDLDADASLSSLQAMLHADPRSDLPNPLIGADHPLRGLKRTAEETAFSWSDLSRGGWVLVDGLRTGAAPVGQPYVVQPLKEDGGSLGARIVDRATKSTGLAIFDGSPAVQALNWTSVGLGVASVGLYGGSWGTRSAYKGAVIAQEDDRIGRLHTTTNVLAVGSAVAVSLGLGAFTAGRFID